jgi:hypothetical protein
MDQVTAQALTLYARMKGMSRTEAAQAGAAPTLLTTIPASIVRSPEPRALESETTATTTRNGPSPRSRTSGSSQRTK